MLAEEWPLIVFTLLTQISAGTFLFSGINSLIANKEKNIQKQELIIVFIIGFLGLIFAFFHLGKPLHAINALNNLSSSWMSREILFVAIFLLITFVLLLKSYSILRFKSSLKSLLVLLNIIIIIALTYSMIHIYYLPTIISWNNIFTWYEFISCTLILGALLFLMTEKKHVPSRTIKRIGIMLFILFILNIIVIVNDDFVSFFTVMSEIVLNSIAMILAITMLYLYDSNHKNLHTIYTWLLIIALISETIGRFAFYLGFESAGI